VTTQEPSSGSVLTSQVRAAGSCHGFQVRSSLPLDLLREPLPAGDWDELMVERADHDVSEPTVAPIREWLPAPGKPFSARLYATTGGFGMWIDGVGGYVIDPTRSIISVPPDIPSALAESRLWGVPSVLMFLRSGHLSLHAAAVQIEDRAVLLTAPGRHGKTTLAAAFHQAGFRLLSEDLCRVNTEAEPSVFPAAAMLRLRHDVRTGLGALPSTEVVFEDEQRVHLGVTGERRGGGTPVPIAAVVTLHIGTGPPVLERIDAVDAVRDLWSLSFNLPTDADRARCFLGVSSIAASVPVWRLTRALSFDALPAVIDRIATTCVT
jgi:hypothetical protein